MGWAGRERRPGSGPRRARPCGHRRGLVAPRRWRAGSFGLRDALHRQGDRGDLRPDVRLDPLGDVLVRLEELLARLAALAQARLAVVEPGAGLSHYGRGHTDVEQAALFRDAL